MNKIFFGDRLLDPTRLGGRRQTHQHHHPRLARPLYGLEESMTLAGGGVNSEGLFSKKLDLTRMIFVER